MIKKAELELREYLDRYFEIIEERPFRVNRGVSLDNEPELLRFFCSTGC